METAGAMKLRKTPKQVFHNFTAPWKTRSRKSVAASFPQFPQGRLLVAFFSRLRKAKSTSLHGEYRIDVWHGDNQCLSLSDEFSTD
jgi:hypothetical protein